MRALITGASGFIGSGVLRHMLDETEWDFTCLCSWRHRGHPFNIEQSQRVEVITHDLTGPLPDMGSFDYILHLASESHVDRSIEHPVEFIENNVSSTLQVLEYARKYKPRMFIMFSTDEVFGAKQHLEWDVLYPSNPYSASKAAQEMISIAYWSTYKLPIVITNSNNIVGARQDREKFLPKLIHLIGNDERVAIHTANSIPGKRFYNPVQNVGDALLYILRKLEGLSIDRPSRYNLPGGEELDNFELAKLVAQTMGKQLRYHFVDVSSIRPGYDEFYPRTDGMLSILGWKPVTTFRGALPDIIKSYTEGP